MPVAQVILLADLSMAGHNRVKIQFLQHLQGFYPFCRKGIVPRRSDLADDVITRKHHPFLRNIYGRLTGRVARGVDELERVLAHVKGHVLRVGDVRNFQLIPLRNRQGINIQDFGLFLIKSRSIVNIVFLVAS